MFRTEKGNAFQHNHEMAFHIATQSARTGFEHFETKTGSLYGAEVETYNHKYLNSEVAHEWRDRGLTNAYPECLTFSSYLLSKMC